MTQEKTENIIGALSLALSDTLLRAAALEAPHSAPAAAIALLGHAPGLSIDQLARAMGLSHPGCVRLVDRLERDTLVIRARSSIDGRAVALTLTKAGKAACRRILSSRQGALSRALKALSPPDQEMFGRIAEAMLRSMLTDVDHAMTVCRLCDPAVCVDCPVEAEMMERAAAGA